MKLRSLCTLALAGGLTSSCIYYTNPVPEMPYQPYRRTAAAVPPLAPMPQTEGVWQTTPPPAAATPTAAIPDPYVGATSAPIPAPRTAVPAPAPAPAAKPATAITQPPLKLNPPATPAKPITVKPAAAPKPAATPAHATSAANPAEITNKGSIPVATPVPGDPTRVYNPLDSSKTIRITDKNGKVYPSGKELKVRGTNFHFYVP